MLERPSNAKSPVVKRALAAMFAPLALRFGQSFSIVTSLINSVLCKHEHSVIPLAELMQQFVEDHKLSHLVGDALREVGTTFSQLSISLRPITSQCPCQHILLIHIP